MSTLPFINIEMVLLRITYLADLPDLKELMQIDDNKKKN